MLVRGRVINHNYIYRIYYLFHLGQFIGFQFLVIILGSGYIRGYARASSDVY